MSAFVNDLLSGLGVDSGDMATEERGSAIPDPPPAEAAPAPPPAQPEPEQPRAARAPPASLADAEARQGASYQIKVLLTPETAQLLDQHPYPLDGSLGEAPADDAGRTVRTAEFNVFYSDDDGGDLLAWFRKLAGAPKEGVASHKDALTFPSTFTKEQRARWHRLAEKAGLESASEGVGEARHLSIKLKEGLGGHWREKKAGEWGQSKVRERAKQLYNWCQDEGGAVLNYSHAELQELVARGGPLPPDLAQLAAKRETLKSLMRQLAARDSRGALALLQREPGLVWLKDEKAGGYPLHMAAYHGLTEVVTLIAQQRPALEQRDRQRKTPLQVARGARQEACVRALLAAGAKDPAAAGGSGRRPPGDAPATPAPREAPKPAGGEAAAQEHAAMQGQAAPETAGPPEADLQLALSRGGRALDAGDLLTRLQRGPLAATLGGRAVSVSLAQPPPGAQAAAAELLEAAAAMEAACAALRLQATAAAPPAPPSPPAAEPAAEPAGPSEEEPQAAPATAGSQAAGCDATGGYS